MYFPGQKRETVFTKLFRKVKALAESFSRRYKLTKSVHIYISGQKEQLIIAPQYVDKSGLIIEQEECFVYEYPVNSTKLGEELFRCINLFYYKDENIRIEKDSDWPAFKHSKCKTMKAFMNEYILISVSSTNDGNIILKMEGHPYKDSLLTINSTISCYLGGTLSKKRADELGNRIFLVYEACLSKQFS
ncbi:hypothetical protein CLV62_13528 [Dysgonomonas alginatilytica]|uniref:Uncharacterized protein n=2 Tax=Dysgonomonas alginatilytica TaxID=1605892 RepID=A0A2V3PIS1_9BACT|nr:hypothetical protein CLV62_13528 [Dysgonomonas alginatilytica]